MDVPKPDVYVYVHAYVCARAYACVYVYVCVCVCVCVCVNTCVHRAINLASANMKKDVDVLQLLPHASLELLVTEGAISESTAHKVCCSVLHVAVRCIVVHCVAVCWSCS